VINQTLRGNSIAQISGVKRCAITVTLNSMCWLAAPYRNHMSTLRQQGLADRSPNVTRTTAD
jgi:hypothetical protein